MKHSDPTAYQAMNITKNPGEIWKAMNERKYLVLKDHGAWSSVLVVWDEYRNGCITIENISKKPMYVNPAMMTFMFNSGLYDLCGAVSLLVVEEIKAMLAVVLDMPIRQDKATVDRLAASMQEVDKLKVELEAVCKQRDVYKERAETLVPAPDPEATMYKRMYFELLDRIVQRG